MVDQENSAGRPQLENSLSFEEVEEAAAAQLKESSSHENQPEQQLQPGILEAKDAVQPLCKNLEEGEEAAQLKESSSHENQPPQLKESSSHENQPEQQLQPGILEAKNAVQPLLKEGKHNYYGALCHAANRGDWKTVQIFIHHNLSALTARITVDSFTLLMVAAKARKWELVEKLINMSSAKELELQNDVGATALHIVARVGNLKIAEAMIKKSPNLQQIGDKDGYCPLFSAMESNCKEMVWYLVLVTKDNSPCFPYSGPLAAELLRLLMRLSYFDVILYLLGKYPCLVTMRDEKQKDRPCILALAIRYRDFLSGTKLHFWETWIYKLIHVEIEYMPPESILIKMDDYLAEHFPVRAASIQPRNSTGFQLFKRLLCKTIEKLAPPIKHIREVKWKHLHANELLNYYCSQFAKCLNLDEIIEISTKFLRIATETGIVEIVEAFLHHFPSVMMGDRSYSYDVLRDAIRFRQPKIFKLITKEMPTIITSMAFRNIDHTTNMNILHLVAKTPPPITNQVAPTSCAVFEMQRELQWYEEVKKVAPSTMTLAGNTEGITPGFLFTREHQGLVEKGEKWMKDTANSGVIVTTLIITVIIAAAFTVPGGNNDKGIPNFLDTMSFSIFVVSDALALFSSATSLLMFVSILTARYEEKDFLRALPKRIIIGLGSLFCAIVCMMVAFGATLYIVVGEKWPWAYIPIILLGLVPVSVFAMLQLPLFMQMIYSTYGSGALGS